MSFFDFMLDWFVATDPFEEDEDVDGDDGVNEVLEDDSSNSL